MRFSRALFAVALCGSATIFAAPKIEADKTTLDCGTVVEGQGDQIDAYFTIRNTGDAPLRIENVRPGCGCTVVTFDTVVGLENPASSDQR